MYKVYFKGGLGNQLFQFAFAFYLAKGDINKIIFDKSLLKYNNIKNTRRNFLLKFLDKKLNCSLFSALKIMFKIRLCKLNNNVNIIHDKNLSIRAHSKNYDICGYFQDDLFYLEDIKNELCKFINYKLSENVIIDSGILPDGNSVSVHIRRGDYVNNKFSNKVHKILDLDYYLNSINFFNIDTTVFYIFTDDINWVEKFLLSRININYIFASKLGLSDLEEFFLMSKCKNNIIANSTYSWWAAFLNSSAENIIISPSAWFNDKRNFPKITNAIYI